MRNLKRALSLTLASVMLLGMMVIGTSAAGYPDVDDSHNVEAIEVLQAVGAMSGSNSGNFNPDAKVSRVEMAIVMANLLDLDVDYFAGQNHFTDVPAWAGNYVAACEANGIISGVGGDKFGTGNVTATQAALMMMKALGYFQYASDFGTDWARATANQAARIRLFDGIDVANNTQLTRNQVAQLALNALEASMVDPQDDTISITTPDGTSVQKGKVNYVVRASTQSFAKAISTAEANAGSVSGTNGCTVELGEQLYNGKLKLNDDSRTDDFGRPARNWEYDGKDIGTYAKTELLRKEYTSKVTGKMLYELLGNDIINKNDYGFNVAIDGNDGGIDKTELTRNNTNAVGSTGKGVLTQVFVDTRDRHENIYIVVINTYLAKATEDYDSKNEDVNLDVYALDNTGDSKNPVYVKDRDKEKDSITVKNDDIFVENVKENDLFLVTVADGKVQSMAAPEILSDSSIDSFKVNSDVTVDSTTYEYAHTAKYDVEVLDEYSKTNLKDTTYNIILDKYGYLIGLEQNEEADQYVFLTGLDGKYSPLSSKSADANVIFLDGRMETVTVNMSKSAPIENDGGTPTSVEGGDWLDGNGTPREYSQINTWCTYSVNSKNVYTLKEVNFAMGDKKVAQNHEDASGGDIKVDRKNVTLAGEGGTGRVYGNDNTVYINVEPKAVNTTAAANGYRLIIDDVDSVTTGTKNVSLVVKDFDTTGKDGSNKDKATPAADEVYTLFNNKGYIIAAVTIGEDEGMNKVFAYVTSSGVKRESYSKADDEWTWVREAVVDGKVTDLKEVGGGTDLSELKDMTQNAWYELKLDADGNVKSADKLTFAAGTSEYANDIQYVDDVIDDHDTAILFHKAMTREGDVDTISYRNGTLYVNTDDVKGFDVSPDVKTVVCLSDGKGNDFDDVDDSYAGYSGLERAIRNLDSNFAGDLSAIFDKGSAVVIIFNDTTDAEEGGTPPNPPVVTDGYSSVVDTTIQAANLPAGLKLSNASVTNDDKLQMPVIPSESVATQIKDAMAALKYTDVTMSLASGTYTIKGTDPDGLARTLTYKADGTYGDVFYKLTVNGTLVEYTKKGEASKTKAPAAADAKNPGTGYLTADNAEMTTNGTYAAYSDTAYVANAAKDSYVKTGYVSIGAITTTSLATNFDLTYQLGTGEAVAATPAYAPVNSTLKVILTVKTAIDLDADATADTIKVTGTTASSSITCSETGLVDAASSSATTLTFVTTADTELAVGKTVTVTYNLGATGLTDSTIAYAAA